MQPDTKRPARRLIPEQALVETVRDSNPRDGCPSAPLSGECNQPLCHPATYAAALSKWWRQRSAARLDAGPSLSWFDTYAPSGRDALSRSGSDSLAARMEHDGRIGP